MSGPVLGECGARGSAIPAIPSVTYVPFVSKIQIFVMDRCLLYEQQIGCVDDHEEGSILRYLSLYFSRN